MLSAFFEAFVITFAIFFLAGYMLRTSVSKIQEEETEDIKLMEQFEDAIVLCKVEQIQDVFYLYNSQDESFVGQARDLKEFTELSERLQKHLMVVDGKDNVIAELKKATSETSISQ